MVLHICTAGTSIAGGPMREAETPAMYRRRIDQKLQQERNNLRQSSRFLVRASAETNGLVRTGACDQDEVVFLVSETDDGRICGEKLVTLVENEFRCPAKVIEINGLQVRDGRRFRMDGVRNLFNALDKVTSDTLSKEIRLNATGGFKGTVPYLVLYGMFYGLPVSYVYELSESVVTLPNLPIEFDWQKFSRAARVIFAVFDAIELSIAEWRKLLPDNYFELEAEYNSLFEIDSDSGKVGLSALGYLVNSRLEASARVTPLLLSPTARYSLDNAGANVRPHFDFMLARVRDPLYRAGYRHSEHLHTSDLLIWKRNAGTFPRMAYWVSSASIYVGELFPTHSDYDYFREKVPKNRIDYDLASFLRYEPPPNLDYGAVVEEISSSELDARKKFLALEEERETLRKSLIAVEVRKNAEMGAALQRVRQESEERSKRQQGKLQETFKKMIEERNAEIGVLRRKIAVLAAVGAGLADATGGDPPVTPAPAPLAVPQVREAAPKNRRRRRKKRKQATGTAFGQVSA